MAAITGLDSRILVVPSGPAPSGSDKLAGSPPMGPTRMRLSKPVIAAIAGHAVAGGLELALWCDLRVVEEDAVFGVFCRRWGVPLIDGGTVRLPRLIGASRAIDMILTCLLYTSDAADEEDSVDLGGRRIIKKKKKKKRKDKEEEI